MIKMSLKYYFLLSFKNFFRRKINYLNILLLSVSILLIVFSLSFSKTFTEYIDNQINGNIDHHIVVASDVDGITNLDLNSLEGIEFVSNYDSYRVFVDTSNDEELRLVGFPKSYLKKITNKEINDTKVLVCPSRFYLGKNISNNPKELLDNIQDGKDFINKKINILSDDYNEEYTIIDTYDVNKYTYGEYNICFTLEDNIKEIHQKEMDAIKKECEEANEVCYFDTYETKVLFVKDVKKVDSVINILRNANYRTDSIIHISYAEIDFLSMIIIGIGLILLVVSFAIILVSNNKYIQYSKKNNLIYKALGYDNKTLIKINYCESLILTIISMIVSLIFVFIAYKYLSIKYAAEIKLGANLFISYNGLIISFVLLLIVPLLSSFLSLMNNNNTIIEELNDGEI